MIEVITGQESWQNHSAKFSCFFVDPETLKETPLQTYVRQLPGGSGASIVNRVSIQARPGMKSELGMWYRTNYMLPVRTILKVYAQRHTHQGAPDQKAMVYLRLRDEAAHRRFALNLSRTNAALLQAYIDGRFDVLPLETVDAMGIGIADHFRRFFDAHATALFYKTELSPETTTQPVVRRVRIRNEQGKEVTFVRTRKPRKLKLD